jgi:hypothetical protein
MQKRVKKGGRTKGTPNKMTTTMKKTIETIINEELLPRFSQDIQELTPYERTKLLSTLLRYFVPSVMPEIPTSEDNRPIIVIDSRI